jgi:hypothetical protein
MLLVQLNLLNPSSCPPCERGVQNGKAYCYVHVCTVHTFDPSTWFLYVHVHTVRYLQDRTSRSNVIKPRYVCDNQRLRDELGQTFVPMNSHKVKEYLFMVFPFFTLRTSLFFPLEGQGV